MRITNLKVWKLSDAKLDGTRELLDTDEVTATVQATAPILVKNKSDGKFKDADGNDDEKKFWLASTMLAYINASSIGMNDGMDYVEECLDAAECRNIFEMIFDAMDQKQHYDMMMGIQ